MRTLLLVVTGVAACTGPEPRATPEPPPPPAAPMAGRAPTELERRVAALRDTVPAGFTVVAEPPFAVIGNGHPDDVRDAAEGTVRWAVTRLKRDFFDRDPDRILEIWLFSDGDSYRRYARALWGDTPDTPFGYYSSADGVLVMNIATGGGTLVHEIVHPFMEANFPAAPAWFNEGLGSLYEQSSSRDGHIIGLTNWRLAGLQDAIAAGELPSFRELTGTTTAEFYDDPTGTNYAQARYLLYYLQEQGLLVEFYRSFLRDHRRDPTGYDTLKAVLDLDDADMPAFERRWRRYVQRLTFP